MLRSDVLLLHDQQLPLLNMRFFGEDIKFSFVLLFPLEFRVFSYVNSNLPKIPPSKNNTEHSAGSSGIPSGLYVL